MADSGAELSRLIARAKREEPTVERDIQILRCRYLRGELSSRGYLSQANSARSKYGAR